MVYGADDQNFHGDFPPAGILGTRHAVRNRRDAVLPHGIVCALCTAFAATDGFASRGFAVSALLCIVVITDAVGVRRETGKQSQALNTLLARVFTEKDKTQLPDHFRELIGHTPLQVACGAVLGVVVALLLHLIPAFGG